jgi:ribosomal protein S18 acetylase RimI-like enzyme
VGGWLHDVKGIVDQWDKTISDEEVDFLIRSGETYLAVHESGVVGSVRVTERPAVPWEDWSHPAFYVHTLAVRRRYSGRGIGRRILAWAEQEAGRRRLPFLRLDCMAANDRLCRYYQEAGFTPLGQHRRHTWFALFERRAGEVPAELRG